MARSGFLGIGFALLALALAEPGRAAALICDTVWHDAARNRDLPVRVRLPDAATFSGRVPVVLFSHGLGGSVDAGAIWARDWANAGIATVHLQHPGSDASVWSKVPQPERMAALKAAANAQQLLARVADVRFAVDTLVAGGDVGGCDLSRLDATRIGMAGHSFGAGTVQAVAGQRFAIGSERRSIGDPRIKAFIAFSPSATSALRGATTPAQQQTELVQAFGQITVPFLSVTGTRDLSPIDPALTAASRQQVFEGLPRGNDYLLVINDADHIVLGGGNGEGARLRTTTSADDKGIERVVGQVTTVFWLAMLGGSDLATQTLKAMPPAALRTGDSWQTR